MLRRALATTVTAAVLVLSGPAVTHAVSGAAIVAGAASYRGVPYHWGGTTRRGVDCSGLVWRVYRNLGVKVPRTADAQYRRARRIPRSAARPGDLVFWVRNGHAYHVAVYAGHGKVWVAPRRGKRVHLQALYGRPVFGRL